jgi:hypothetical protein
MLLQSWKWSPLTEGVSTLSMSIMQLQKKFGFGMCQRERRRSYSSHLTTHPLSLSLDIVIFSNTPDVVSAATADLAMAHLVK